MINLTFSADPQFQNPANCQNKFTLPSNNFTVCDISARGPQIDFYEKKVLIEGPPFVTFLWWLVNKDEKWTNYSLISTLPLEETKKIAASMCLE